MDIPFGNPVIQFLYWLLHDPGLGGISVILVGAASILGYGLTLLWVRAGGEVDEVEVYSYPTSALIHSHEDET